MAKSKAKTVKARVAVVYNGKGGYQAGGYGGKNDVLDDACLIKDANEMAPKSMDAYPHACIVDIELPIPKPLKGTVIKVTQVER